MKDQTVTISPGMLTNFISTISSFVTKKNALFLVGVGATVLIAARAAKAFRPLPVEPIPIPGTPYWGLVKSRNDVLNIDFETYTSHKTKPGDVAAIHLSRFADNTIQLCIIFHGHLQATNFLRALNTHESNIEWIASPNSRADTFGRVNFKRSADADFYEVVLNALIAFDASVLEIKPLLSKSFKTGNTALQGIFFEAQRLCAQLDEMIARSDIKREENSARPQFAL